MNRKLDLNLFIAMKRANAYLDKASAPLFAKHGLTSSQFAVLEVLYHKGNLSIGEVQDKILSSTGTMPLIIKNLEKQGFILKTQCKNDKRKFYLELSPTGEELIAEVFKENAGQIEEDFSVLNEEEKETFLYLLKKVSRYRT